jgi:choice-of-anchor A domain-containing protein
MSLVEVLVAIVLLGITGSAVLLSAATAARGASVHREQSDLQLVLLSAADVVQGRPPEPCATAAATYQSEARARMVTLTLERGWDPSQVTVASVRSWNPTTRTFDATCATVGAMQLVRLVVTPVGSGPPVDLDVLTGSGNATTTIGNPMGSASDQWSIISDGDVTISGGQVYGGLAVGGDLRFTASGPIAANSQGTYGPVLGTTTRVGLLVNGRIVISSGTLHVNQSASAIVGDMTGQRFIPNGGTGCIVRSTASSCTPPMVSLQGTGSAVQGRPYDFAGVFDTYRKASTAMASLVPSCANATPVVLRDQNDAGPWPGSGSFHLRLTSGRVNVWNLTETQLQSWSGFNNNGSNRPSVTTPLVINVTTSDGNVSFNAPQWLQADSARFIIWNFPDAATVTFSGALWGSLYAPRSAVTLTSDVRGVVIARSVVAAGGVSDWNARPAVNIDCPRPA